jgi:DNA polymerase-3 subunit beta
MSAIINAKYYAEAGAFTSKEETRYTLKAIRVEPHPEGGAVIVATDGHTLGLFYDEAGICDKPAQIEFRKEIARFCEPTTQKDKTTFVRLMQIDDDVTIVEAMSGCGYDEEPLSRVVRFFNVTAQGSFPDWRMVLPTAPSESHLDFNPDYLARGASGSKASPGISVWAENPEAQAVVRSSREDFIAIVMPMKGFTESPYPPYVQALIARRPSASVVEADDPSLFGEIDKAETEPKADKGNGKVPTISVNLEKKCSACGKKGATENGRCIECGGADGVMAGVVTRALEAVTESGRS